MSRERFARLRKAYNELEEQQLIIRGAEIDEVEVITAARQKFKVSLKTFEATMAEIRKKNEWEASVAEKENWDTRVQLLMTDVNEKLLAVNTHHGGAEVLAVSSNEGGTPTKPVESPAEKRKQAEILKKYLANKSAEEKKQEEFQRRQEEERQRDEKLQQEKIDEERRHAEAREREIANEKERQRIQQEAEDGRIDLATNEIPKAAAGAQADANQGQHEADRTTTNSEFGDNETRDEWCERLNKIEEQFKRTGAKPKNVKANSWSVPPPPPPGASAPQRQPPQPPQPPQQQAAPAQVDPTMLAIMQQCMEQCNNMAKLVATLTAERTEERNRPADARDTPNLLEIVERRKIQPPVWRGKDNARDWLREWKLFAEQPGHSDPNYLLSTLKNVCLKSAPEVMQEWKGIDMSNAENLPRLIDKIKKMVPTLTDYIQNKMSEISMGLTPPAGFSKSQGFVFTVNAQRDLDNEIRSQLEELYNREVTQEEVESVISRVIKYTVLQKRLPELMIAEVLTKLNLDQAIEDYPAFQQAILEAAEKRDKAVHKGTAKAEERAPRQASARAARQQQGKCLICDKPSHLTRECRQLIEKETPEEKFEVIKSRGVCKCLKGKFPSCKCFMKKEKNCDICKRSHDTLLHTNESTAAAKRNVNARSSPETTHKEKCVTPIVEVELRKADGTWVTKRALLDTGATEPFGDEATMKQLQLPFERVNVVVSGYDNDSSIVNKRIITEMRAKNNPSYTFIEAILVHPTLSFEAQGLNIPLIEKELSDCVMADGGYRENRRVDLILTSARWMHAKGQRSKFKSLGKYLRAEDSAFGYIISGGTGRVEQPSKGEMRVLKVRDVGTLAKLDKFFEREYFGDETGEKFDLTPPTEKYYTDTTKKDEENFYVVSLPFKDNYQLGRSEHIARKRTENTYKKLSSAEREVYNGEIQKLLEKEIIQPAPKNVPGKFYLCHFGVKREESLTTKLRVVFDGSAKTTNGKSLNDVIHQGCNKPSSIWGNLLRLRKHEVALASDIEGMFHRVKIQQDDRAFHRFFQITNEGEWKEFEFTRLVFGINASPSLAIRTLVKIAEDNEAEFPVAADFVRRCFYVDDFLTSVATKEEAKKLVDEMIELLKRGNFHLRKWVSNKPQVISNVPREHRLESIEREVTAEGAEDVESPILGLTWNVAEDTMRIKVREFEAGGSLTKRLAVSIAGSLYDPCGLISPVTLKMKLAIQQICLVTTIMDCDQATHTTAPTKKEAAKMRAREKKMSRRREEPLIQEHRQWMQENLRNKTAAETWDVELPQSIAKNFHDAMSNLERLKELEIPRFVNFREDSKTTLLMSCDASSHGIGATVHLRVEQPDGSITCHLMLSKGNVKSLSDRFEEDNGVKQIIARQELTAAVIGSLLLQTVQTELQMEECEYVCFSDSRVALSWITAEEQLPGVFERTRVQKILGITASDRWHYIATEENPADLASRACLAPELIDNSLWWHGPRFFIDEDLKLAERKPHIDCRKREVITIKAIRSANERSKSNDTAPMRRVKQLLAYEHELRTNDEKNYLVEICCQDRALEKTWRLMARLTQYVDILRARVLKRRENRAPRDLKEALAEFHTIQELIRKSPGKPSLLAAKKKFVGTPLSAEQVMQGEMRYIAIHQVHHETSLVEALLDRKKLKEPFHRLSLFFDVNGIIRLDTPRVNLRSEVIAAQPILIPKVSESPAEFIARNSIARKMIEEMHKRVLHRGTSSTNAEFRAKYHMIGLSQKTQRVLKSCITCRREQAKVEAPPTGNLATPLTYSSVYEYVAIDGCGPFEMYCERSKRKLRETTGVGINKTQKVWILIFVDRVCGHTNLEIILDNTPLQIMNAIARHTWKFGFPREILSDNHASFKFCAKELKTLFNMTDNSEAERAFESLANFLSDHQIEISASTSSAPLKFDWSFSPPFTPQSNNKAESMVKLVKKPLVRALNRRPMTHSELNSELIHIAAVINSRPLAVLQMKRNVPELILRPNLFTNHRNIAAGPDFYLKPSPMSMSKRLMENAKALEDFFEIFQRDYLHTLKQKTQVDYKLPPVQEGEMVIISDKNAKRGQWKEGIITAVKRDERGIARQLTIRKANGNTLNTGIQNVVRLMPEHELNHEAFSSKIAERHQSGPGPATAKTGEEKTGTGSQQDKEKEDERGAANERKAVIEEEQPISHRTRKRCQGGRVEAKRTSIRALNPLSPTFWPVTIIMMITLWATATAVPTQTKVLQTGITAVPEASIYIAAGTSRVSIKTNLNYRRDERMLGIFTEVLTKTCTPPDDEKRQMCSERFLPGAKPEFEEQCEKLQLSDKRVMAACDRVKKMITATRGTLYHQMERVTRLAQEEARLGIRRKRNFNPSGLLPKLLEYTIGINPFDWGNDDTAVRGAAQALEHQAKAINELNIHQQQAERELHDNLDRLTEAMKERDAEHAAESRYLEVQATLTLIWQEYQLMAHQMSIAYRDEPVNDDDLRQILRKIDAEQADVRTPPLQLAQLAELITFGYDHTSIMENDDTHNITIILEVPLVRRGDYHLIHTMPVPTAQFTHVPDMKPQRVILSDDATAFVKWEEVDVLKQVNSTVYIVEQPIFNLVTDDSPCDIITVATQQAACKWRSLEGQLVDEWHKTAVHNTFMFMSNTRKEEVCPSYRRQIGEKYGLITIQQGCKIVTDKHVITASMDFAESLPKVYHFEGVDVPVVNITTEKPVIFSFETTQSIDTRELIREAEEVELTEDGEKWKWVAIGGGSALGILALAVILVFYCKAKAARASANPAVIIKEPDSSIGGTTGRPPVLVRQFSLLALSAARKEDDAAADASVQ